MLQNRTNQGDNSTLAQLIASIGESEFPERLVEYCQPISEMSSTVVGLFKLGHQPKHLFNNLKSRDEELTVRPYLDGPYLLDPFYSLMVSGSEGGFYLLDDIAPDKFHESDYYETYFKRTRIEVEAGFLTELAPETYMMVSFGLRHGEGDVLNSGAIKEQVPLLSAICRKHWEVWLGREGAVTFARPLDIAYRNFGKRLLTNREREVMMMMLKGHSGKSMARELDISLETIKIHKRNLYTKLDVNSQSELFAIFLGTLESFPIGSNSDPLELYQNDRYQNSNT